MDHLLLLILLPNNRTAFVMSEKEGAQKGKGHTISQDTILLFGGNEYLSNDTGVNPMDEYLQSTGV